jgi:hypothetical protein
MIYVTLIVSSNGPGDDNVSVCVHSYCNVCSTNEVDDNVSVPRCM